MRGRTQTGIMALVIVVGSLELGQSAGGQAQPILGVLVINEAGVPSHLLRTARQEATRIYHDTGISLIWIERDEKQIGYQFVLKIISHTLKDEAVDAGAMGVASGTKERRGTVAYAFYDRVQDVTRTVGTDPGVILGHVLAHELGHLLLPYDAHTTSGLMRGGWDIDQTMQAMKGTLKFTHREAALIRQRLRKVDDSRTESAAITAVLLNNADVSAIVLQEAKDNASHVYAQAGVKLVWVELGSAVGRSPSHRLTMIIVVDASVGRKGRLPEVMGTAPSPKASVAYAFYKRIEMFAHRYRLDVATMLGCVMAHEMGHLLLARSEHGSDGIMRGRWQLFDLDRARIGQLFFTTRQASEIQASVTEHLELSMGR